MGVRKPEPKKSILIIFENCPVCGAWIRRGGRVPENNPRFTCTECNFSIANTIDNRCAICKKLFSSSASLSEHMLFDHKEERAIQNGEIPP